MPGDQRDWPPLLAGAGRNGVSQLNVVTVGRAGDLAAPQREARVSIGDTLAQARHQAGLTVAELSERTRVRETVIRGIEGGDYSACGGGFYARGYIRIIAKEIGADPEPLIREYDAVHRAPGALSAVSLDELFTPVRTSAGRHRAGRTAALGLGLGLVVAALGLVAYHFLAGWPRSANALPAAGKHTVAHRRLTSSTNPAPKTSRGPARHTPALPARALTPVSAAAAGPGAGDNPQLARRALDGNHATAWRTDWYTTARFGNLYPGTGLLLDMGHPVTITAVRISLGRASGARLQIRVGAARELARQPPAARVAGARGSVRLPLTRPAHGRYVLLWFTRLPTDPAGTFQASVYEIQLQGRA
jgi:transcriptional regulator with XRE-family HTH domain